MAQNIFKRWKTTGASGVTSDINVTPLVDVMLVLLIIFMIITPMLQSGAAVQLAETEDPGIVEREESQVLLSLQYDLGVYIEADKVAKNLYENMDEFDQRLKDLYTSNPNRKFAVKVDKRLNYGDARKLLRRLQQQGFVDIGLIVDKMRVAKQ
jgi:biopolymer transport protein ExbD